MDHWHTLAKSFVHVINALTLIFSHEIMIMVEGLLKDSLDSHRRYYVKFRYHNY